MPLNGCVPVRRAAIFHSTALIYWLLMLKSGAPERCAVPANQ